MKNKNIFWGLSLIVLAILVALNALGYFHNIGILKIAFTAILLIISFKGLRHLNFFMIIFPIAFILMLYAKQLNITNLTHGPIFFIAFLLSIGLSLIFNNSHSKYFHLSNHHRHSDVVINEPDDSVVNCDVTFGSLVKYVNTDNFTTANIDCSFGSTTVYFDNASISNDSAIINLDVAFGSVELYIPKDWRILKNIDSAFGGIDEKNNTTSPTGPNVTLCGNVNFAGLTIYYV